MPSKRNHEVWLQFRAKLKTAMQKKGLKGYELAKAAGVWATNVSHWLNDGSIPSGPVLMKLARALDMQPEELLPGAGKALHGKDGDDADAYVTGGRRALDELDVLLRELRKKWEQQEHRLAHSARSSSDAVKSQEQTQKRKERRRRSTET